MTPSVLASPFLDGHVPLIFLQSPFGLNLFSAYFLSWSLFLSCHIKSGSTIHETTHLFNVHVTSLETLALNKSMASLHRLGFRKHVAIENSGLCYFCTCKVFFLLLLLFLLVFCYDVFFSMNDELPCLLSLLFFVRRAPGDICWFFFVDQRTLKVHWYSSFWISVLVFKAIWWM